MLLALTFTSYAMLGWLAAAAVPLAIHLWSRRRYRQTSWAAMEYLLAAVKQSRRKLLIEHWLLLAVRTLVVVLVVLAVAEPFWAGRPAAFSRGEQTLRVLVVDGSYSMAYKPDDASRFDRARAIAAEIVGQCPQGDGFALVLMSTPAEVVVGTPVFEPSIFLAQVENLAVGHTRADLASTLSKVEKVLRDARRDYPTLRRSEVYLLTDLCRVGWATEESRVQSRESRESRVENDTKNQPSSNSRLSTLDPQLSAARRVAKLASVTVLDVGQAGAENVALTGLGTSLPLVTSTENVDIEATVRNFGNNLWSRLLVELVVDGQRVRRQPLDLAAGDEASVAFSYRFETAGEHTVEIRLPPDRLAVDDHRYLAVPVKPAIEVLVVDGRPSGRPFGSAAAFLVPALAPHGRAGRVRPHVLSDSALTDVDLHRYDCIFLADVAQFTASEAQVLRSYVESGGGAVFFLGPQVLAERYNRQLGDGQVNQSGVDLLPARIGSIVDAPMRRLDPLEYRHPIVRAFRDRERAGLLTAPVLKHFELTLPPDTDAEIALATEDGDPLIVERPGPQGRGRVVLVGTSADATWTLLPVLPSYVPLVQEMLNFAVRGELVERNVEVGQPLGNLPAEPVTAGDRVPSVRLPDGQSRPMVLRHEAGETTWSYPDTTASGFYTVDRTTPAPADRIYAVNVDTAESDLARLTPQQLRDEVWPGVPFTYATTWQQSSVEPSESATHGGSLARLLLYAVLGLLFVETLLARRFGNQSP